MKKKTIIMTLLLSLALGAAAGCMKGDPEYFKKPDWWTSGEEDEGTGEYRLVWSDEFNDEPDAETGYAVPGSEFRPHLYFPVSPALERGHAGGDVFLAVERSVEFVCFQY